MRDADDRLRDSLIEKELKRLRVAALAEPTTEAGRHLLHGNIFAANHSPSRTELRYHNDLAQQIRAIEAEAVSDFIANELPARIAEALADTWKVYAFAGNAVATLTDGQLAEVLAANIAAQRAKGDE